MSFDVTIGEFHRCAGGARHVAGRSSLSWSALRAPAAALLVEHAVRTLVGQRVFGLALGYEEQGSEQGGARVLAESVGDGKELTT